jgi:GNAT superfamily N-acetyltransferase
LSNSAVRVRVAGADDAAAIEQVRFRSWQQAYRDLIPQSAFAEFDVTRGTSRLAQRMAAGSVLAHVAEADGAVVGFASYGQCRDEDLPDAGEIYAIYVEPEHWSNGVGRALMSAALDTLLHRPVALWVLRENRRARRFYGLAGWSPDGTEKQADLLGGVTAPEVRYRLG